MAGRGLLTLAVLTCGISPALAAPALADSGGATVPTAAATTPATVSATATVRLTKSQTKMVQRRIGVPADGVFGAHSRAALARYQTRMGLVRTGRPNLQTLKAMHLSFASVIQTSLDAVPAPVAPTSTTSPAPTTPTTPVATGAAATALAAARAQLGTKYVWGGDEPGGFDCSGLVMWAYAQAGVDLPRTSYDQFDAGTAVDKADIQPGDLVFFSTDGAGASHVGIATSATTAISATTHGVREHEIFDDYWGPAYVGARRVA